MEWNEAIVISPFGDSNRVFRGGSFGFPYNLAASSRASFSPLSEIPTLLVIAGLLDLAGWRRVRD